YVRTIAAYVWLFFGVVSLCMQRYDDVRLLLAIAAWALATRWLFNRLINAVMDGKPLRAASSVWLASPVPLSILVVFGEHRAFASLFELDKMPVSLIIGDSIVLPAAAAIAAWSVKKSQGLADSEPSKAKKFDGTDSPITWWVCLLLGLAAGISFHVWDAGNYAADHLDVLVGSISKMWHDLVTYVALFGGLLYAFLTIISKTRRYRWRFVMGFVLCILMWAGLGAYDGSRHLNARNFHSSCHLQCGVNNMVDGLGGTLSPLDGFVHSTLDIVRSALEYFLIM
ncbi:MAG TPA: hypothetical protein VLH14_02220, partial [Patescibacteria group bacterium]|nr:hypothetical protein [Patescibacteria group bacterium]